MQDDFTARYGAVEGVALPNAYMVPSAPSRPARTGRIVLGLLSNLSCAKGLDRFIKLARDLRAEGVQFEARLAGPVAEEDAGLLASALTEIPELVHVGPLYGEAKNEFLKNLDLFVFPTNYRNEAQPIVIYEAMAQGVPTLSVDRGCILDQVGDCLEVLPDIATFDRDAADLVARLAVSERSRLAVAQSRAPIRLAEDAERAFSTINGLFGVEGRKG
ncbi:glycosyltransferase [Ruegeria arenilitoris]|uniref:glycosyltransferase n=1 Tax=Ruegeria arenilitoris TaxID=1173585 RepID=UPI001479E3D0|nr:glycosyltransferase [Ruegeria arenilitoris]